MLQQIMQRKQTQHEPKLMLQQQ